MADRGAQGAGRRGAHLRADDLQGRRRLRPLPGHALAGLRRRGAETAVDQRRRRPRPPARSSPTTARRSPTYFFSTSGGRTEDVENTTLGTEPKPWLKSVEDQYDSVSPKHRWGPIRMRYATAASKLRGLVKGRFKGVKVDPARRRRRASCAADVVGSRGRTRVDGATLRARFGLFDTWAYFTAIRTRPTPTPPPPRHGDGRRRAGRRARAGGRRARRERRRPRARARACSIQRRTGGRWVTVDSTAAGRGGRYRAGVPKTGLYRVLFKGDAGPASHVR